MFKFDHVTWPLPDLVLIFQLSLLKKGLRRAVASPSLYTEDSLGSEGKSRRKGQERWHQRKVDIEERRAMSNREIIVQMRTLGTQR